MAACCSSTCAIITGSRNASSILIRRHSPSPRNCAPNGSCASTASVRKRPAGTENAEMPTGLIEVYVTEIEVLGPAAELPVPVFGDQPYPEDMRLQIPVPRPAPRKAAPQHHAARRDHRFAARAHEGAGLLRVPDADSHRLEPRRRARLSRALAPASGQVLRPAAGAAAVQAASHGRGLRPLFPDRAMFPR